MKRSVLSCILILAIMLSLPACGNSNSTVSTQPSITPTTPTTAPTEPSAQESTPEEVPPVVVTITTMDHTVYSESDNGKVELLYDLAVLSGGDPAAVDTINQFLQEKYTDYQEEIPALEVEELLSFFMDADLFYTVICRQSYHDGKILSLAYGVDWMMGGVYNYIPYGYTFDLTTGQHLGLDDLFPGNTTQLLDQIKSAIRLYLKENNLYGTAMDQYAQEEIISGYTLDSLAFYISEAGELVICIPVYELGTGAAGSFTIPTGIYLGDEMPAEKPEADSEVQIAEFLGEPVSVLLDHYGPNYRQENFAGSTFLWFDDSPSFFLGYVTEDIPDDALIRQILTSHPCTLLDDIETSVTYPELVQMVGDTVTLDEPEYIYNAIEDSYKYTLSFDYQNYHFSYTWYEDPEASEADSVYLYRLDIPIVP